MRVELEIAPIIGLLESYLWTFVRIGAFTMVMPAIGGTLVPPPVRILLALALTMVIAPVVPGNPTVAILSAEGLVTVVQEIAIGVAMGFLLQIVFDAISLGGQIIAMSMGLGFAVFLDRARGVNIPVLGQFFLMLGLLIFLSLDGHLAMIRMIADSFTLLPAATGGLANAAVGSLLEWSGQLFVVAVKIALPAVTALLVVNLSFGVMSRAAPTLNLFAVGFPVAMLLGFLVIYVSLGSLQENVTLALREALDAVAAMLGG